MSVLVDPPRIRHRNVWPWQQRRSPLSAVLIGAVAGAAGTLAMDALGYARHRRSGGSDRFTAYEFDAPRDWEQTAVPGQIGRRLLEGLTQREVPAERAPLVNNVVHWAYGTGWGALYGLAAGSLRRQPIWLGLPFGAAVWGTGYAALPATGLYQPIWEYDRRTLGSDLVSHLVYGATTGLVTWFLSLL